MNGDDVVVNRKHNDNNGMLCTLYKYNYMVEHGHASLSRSMTVTVMVELMKHRKPIFFPPMKTDLKSATEKTKAKRAQIQSADAVLNSH